MLSRNNAMVRNRRLIVNYISVLFLSLLIGCNGDGKPTLLVNEISGHPEQFAVYDMVIDANQNKWFATSDGILKLEDNGTIDSSDDLWTTYDLSLEELEGDDIEFSVLEEDSLGNILAASNLAGVIYSFDGSSWDYALTGSDWIEDIILDVVVGRDGVVWTNLGNAILKCDSSMTNCSRFDDSNTDIFQNSFVTALAVDSSNNLFLGKAIVEEYYQQSVRLQEDEVNGFCKIDSSFNEWECYGRDDGLSCGLITYIHEGFNSDILIGHRYCPYDCQESESTSTLILDYKDKVFPNFLPIPSDEIYDTDDSFEDYPQFCLPDGPYIDKYNVDYKTFEFIGPFSYEIELDLQSENMMPEDYIRIENDKAFVLLPFAGIRSFAFQQNTLWIGFYYYGGQLPTVYLTSIGRHLNEIECFDEFDWLFPGGLLKMDIETFNQDYYYQVGECSNVNSFAFDNVGNIWVGTGSVGNPIYVVDEGDDLHSLP